MYVGIILTDLRGRSEFIISKRSIDQWYYTVSLEIPRFFFFFFLPRHSPVVPNLEGFSQSVRLASGKELGAVGLMGLGGRVERLMGVEGGREGER